MVTLQELDIKFSPSDIVVEIDHATNCNVHYKPLGEIMRSAWSQSKHVGSRLSSELNPDIANMPDVPGLLLVLSVKERVFRIIDPLGHVPSKDAVLKNLADHSGREGLISKSDQKWAKLNDEKVATHWYWCKQLVERGYASLLSGKFGEKPKGRVVINESAITQQPEVRYDPKTGKGTPRYLDEKLHQDALYDRETELVPGQ